MSLPLTWWPEIAVVAGAGFLAFLATSRLLAHGVRRDVVRLVALIIAFLFALAACAPQIVTAMEKSASELSLAPILGLTESA